MTFLIDTVDTIRVFVHGIWDKVPQRQGDSKQISKDSWFLSNLGYNNGKIMLFIVMFSAQHEVEERWWMLKIRKLSLSVLWVLLVFLEKVEHLNEQDQTVYHYWLHIQPTGKVSVNFQLHMQNPVWLIPPILGWWIMVIRRLQSCVSCCDSMGSHAITEWAET